MILDIKKLFTKGATIGRFEYIKIVFGLPLLIVLLTSFVVLIPPNNLFYYPSAIIACIIIFSYVLLNYVAIYKRLSNIFSNKILIVIIFIAAIFSAKILLLNIILNLLLILIPEKKETSIISNKKLFWVAFTLIIALIFSSKILGFYRYIVSESMADTLHSKDKIVINIFDKNFHRGDIIAHKSEKNSLYVKRIIALPQEKVEIKTLKNGETHIFINDELLDEPYVKDVYDYPKCSSKIKCETIVVPDNNYYVLGDNRGNSKDSRIYGTVDKSKIKGKVSHIYFPFNRRQVFKTPNYTKNLPQN